MVGIDGEAASLLLVCDFAMTRTYKVLTAFKGATGRVFTSIGGVEAGGVVNSYISH